MEWIHSGLVGLCPEQILQVRVQIKTEQGIRFELIGHVGAQRWVIAIKKKWEIILRGINYF